MEALTNFRLWIFIALALPQVFSTAAISAPLLIAVEDDAGPWSLADGTGFANDVVHAAFTATGASVELTVVPYRRCKDMAVKGTAAACFSMSWLPELDGKIVFAEKPLFSCYSDYFSSNSKPLKSAREGDLPQGTVVGIVSGYEYPPSVYALRDKGVLVLEASDSEEQNLKKLAAGRLDAALLNYNETKPAELLLAKAGATNQVKRAFRSGELRSFIGFSVKHPQGLDALERFNRGYRVISKNGTLGKIERKWREQALTEMSRLAEKNKK